MLPLTVPAAVRQVHYRSFPADALLRWDGADTLRASFFNSLKVHAERVMLSTIGFRACCRMSFYSSR